MQQLVFLSFCAGLFLTGCARLGTSVSPVQPAPFRSSQGLDVSVTRGSENQPIIKVLGAVGPADAEKADLAALEADGYQVASDRFVQMDIARRITRGRLAEVLGPQADATDRQKIGIGLEWAVTNSTLKLKKEHPTIYRALEAFSAGVNRFIPEIGKKHPEWLRQYQLVSRDPNYVPDPWEPSDSIAIATGLSFYLSSNIYDKMSFTAISQVFLLTLRWDDFKGFFNFAPIKPVSILGKPIPEVPGVGPVNRAVGNKHQALGAMSGFCSEDKFSYPLPPCGKSPGLGSNNWVVSRKEAGGDVSLLANDPHLPLFFPMTMYELSIDSKSAGGTFKVRGVKPVGVPSVLIGHNDQIAWGFTNLGADVDDVYIENFTDDGTGAHVGKKIFKVKTEYVRHRVRRRDGNTTRVYDEPVALRMVEGHGPVFSDHDPRMQKLVAAAKTIGQFGSNIGVSYKWTGHPGTTEMAAIVGLNRAQSIEEAKSALNYFQTGIQNVVLADRKGAIGYYAHGDLPVRPYISEDVPPFIAISSEGEAREWAPEYRKQIPATFKNEGLIVTANNNPWDQSDAMIKSPSEYVSFAFTDAIRAHRIKELLEEKKQATGRLTAEDMQVIQNDKKDVLALSMLENIEKIGLGENATPHAQEVYQVLLNWRESGGFAERNAIGPTYFYAVADELLKENFKYTPPDFELPEPLKKYEEMLRIAYSESASTILYTSPSVKTLFAVIRKAAEAEEGSEVRKKAQALITTCLDRGYTALAAKGRLGVEWGKVNRMKWVNPMEGLLPQFINLPVERGGSFETVDPAAPGLGASFRLVMSIPETGPITAKVSVSGGNYSPFELDGIFAELTRWRDGQLRDIVPFAE